MISSFEQGKPVAEARNYLCFIVWFQSKQENHQKLFSPSADKRLIKQGIGVCAAIG